MTALYLLTSEYRAAAARLADLDLPAEVISDTLESMAGELETKAQAVAIVSRGFDADASAMRAWAAAAIDRAKSIEARAEALRDYLAKCMIAADIHKIEGPGVAMTFRKSSAVVIDSSEQVPAAYMRQPETPLPAPDKAAIGAALKAGQDVPGARLEVRQNLQIK